MPLLGGFPPEYCHNVWYGKVECVAIRRCKKFRIHLLVSTEYTNVTDRQTDPVHDGIGRAYAQHLAADIV